eukprot:m.1650001 g.1650001  ORF g.1650001 m.1650001 type:complete len:68 (-) comp84875_c0_seq1:13-216(-)
MVFGGLVTAYDSGPWAIGCRQEHIHCFHLAWKGRSASSLLMATASCGYAEWLQTWCNAVLLSRLVCR